jgi:hypothetical protein
MTRIKTMALLGAATLALGACSGANQTGNAAAEDTVFLNDEGGVEDTNLTAVDGALTDNIADEQSGTDATVPATNADAGNGI